MSGQAPAKGHGYPFQRVYENIATGAVDIDLTTALGRKGGRACNALFVIAAGAGNLVWEDCSGNENTLAIPSGFADELPFSAVRLDATTHDDLSVVALWKFGG